MFLGFSCRKLEAIEILTLLITRHAKYLSVTLRSVRVTTAAVGGRAVSTSYITWVCVCNFIYPALKAHAPHYIVICDLSGSTTSLHSNSQTEWFSEKKRTDNKICVLSLKYYINRHTQPCSSNILVFIQHYHVFRLSTSAIMRDASVYKKCKKGRGLPDDGWWRRPKHVVVLNKNQHIRPAWLCLSVDIRQLW